MFTKKTGKSKAKFSRPLKKSKAAKPRAAKKTTVKEKKNSPLIHLERASELYHPLVAVQPQSSGLLGSLKSVVQRVQVVKRKRADDDQVLEKMEHIFAQLHDDFDERERMLEAKLQSIQRMQVKETKMLKWFSIPMAILAMIGVSFLFYIAYSMQDSVADMSSNMSVMSGDISTMTGSMQNMDYNMAYMARDVSNMNRNMGSMSRSIAPMGQAAESASPMIGMMRSFMPF